jgi:hypothetical protein
MARSSEALAACARWLRYCLTIGWSRSDLDQLEEIWWRYHDDRGRFIELK